jgi:hypothetical protein
VRSSTCDSGWLEAVKNTHAGGDTVLTGAIQTDVPVLMEGQFTRPRPGERIEAEVRLAQQVPSALANVSNL